MRDIMTGARAHSGKIRLALTVATLSVAAFAGSLLSADKAEAGYDPRYPYCVETKIDQIIDCSHVSLEECRFTANGIGYCFANPFYAGPPPGYAPRRTRRVRH